MNIVCLFCFFYTITNSGNVKLSFLVIAGGPPVGNGSISTASRFLLEVAVLVNLTHRYSFPKILLGKIKF